MSELTVKELIEKLEAVEDKSLPVMTEGCDCDGKECNVRVENDRVYITRDDREEPTHE